ncbi:hypothetical protein P691DRAFT_767992 [Macrolepiota fuliginosa MF-IS2]|uniref:Uncharacterized protein n=1 Tax=Macrolepiota fuliginosa MF-IS2 TaxID=1400762 RepID=A0A9P6BUL8_9AGAR|nr:hypothetical protein P691DRAFT_767992 [Macrolepiota fuliginosa MF-IS2]
MHLADTGQMGILEEDVPLLDLSLAPVNYAISDEEYSDSIHSHHFTRRQSRETSYGPSDHEDIYSYSQHLPFPVTAITKLHRGIHSVQIKENFEMTDTGSIRRASRRVSSLFSRKRSDKRGSNESLSSIFEDDANALPRVASEGPFAPETNPPPIGSKRTISPATSFHEELARKTNKLSIEDDTSSQRSAAGSSGSDESARTARSILPGHQASAFVPPAGIAPLGSVVPDSQDSIFHQRAFTPEDPNSMKSPIAINMVTPAQQYAAGIDLQRPSPTTWAPSPIPHQPTPQLHSHTILPIIRIRTCWPGILSSHGPIYHSRPH